MRSSARVRLAGLLLTAGAVAVPAAPAVAHGTDPTLVPVLESVTPELPAGVVVQVRTGLSEQMVLANRTGERLLVLDPEGTPFLRLSRTGVFGNVAAPYFHRTLNPPDVPPRIPDLARDGAKPRWVMLSTGESFGWFEPRLHPAAPGTEAAAAVVSQWEVGLRLGAAPVRVAGVLQRRAVTGSFLAQAAPRDDLQVTVAQGRVPALLLLAPPERRVVVQGVDGLDFLRLDADGVFANTASASFRSNLDFVDRAGGREGWIRVGEPGRVRWLDTRLQYSADRPPEVVERAGRVAELARWAIPVTVDGAPAPLRGTLSWHPAAATPATGGGSGTPWAAAAAGGVLAAGLVALAVVARRRRAGTAAQASPS